MKHIKIYDDKANSFYSIKEVGDFEYVNPIEKMIEVTRNISIINDRNLLSLLPKDNIYSKLNIHTQEKVIDKVLEKNALKLWEDYLKRIMSEVLPSKLFDILESHDKKEQKKILKGISFTIDGLMWFIIQAFENYGFTFSQYLSRHYPNNFDVSQLPNFAIKNKDNHIKTIGDTTLTEGQIKSAIEQKHAVVAKFLDKGNIWHCFFQTYKSVNGDEVNQRPHLHYISHAWGLSREEVLFQLRSKNYKLPSTPHIDFRTENICKNENTLTGD